MFIVETDCNETIAAAFKMLAEHKVNFHVSNTDTHIVIIVSIRDDMYDDFRICEMAFQMNFRQKGTPLCGHCKDEVACGHLVFTKVLSI